MEITEVRIKLVTANNDKLRAFCSITIDNDFVVRDLKVIEGSKGPFVAMPSRKLTRRCNDCGAKNPQRSRYCNNCGIRLPPERPDTDFQRQKVHADIAHPINSRCRELIQAQILDRYASEVERSKQPDYQPQDLEVFDDEEFVGEPREAVEDRVETSEFEPRVQEAASSMGGLSSEGFSVDGALPQGMAERRVSPDVEPVGMAPTEGDDSWRSGLPRSYRQDSGPGLRRDTRPGERADSGRWGPEAHGGDRRGALRRGSERRHRGHEGRYGSEGRRSADEAHAGEGRRRREGSFQGGGSSPESERYGPGRGGRPDRGGAGQDAGRRYSDFRKDGRESPRPGEPEGYRGLAESRAPGRSYAEPVSGFGPEDPMKDKRRIPEQVETEPEDNFGAGIFS